MEKPLQGRVAIVTGGGTGIGKATALALAGAGSQVALSSRTKTRLLETKSEIEDLGGIAEVFPADMSDVPQCVGLIEDVFNRFGRLDILINNAAHFSPGVPLAEAQVEDWDAAFATNVRGPFVLSKAAIPYLKNQPVAHIVNILSVGARRHYVNSGVYVATKQALRGMTIVLSKELRETTNIRVHAVYPGGIDTAPMQSAVTGGARSDLKNIALVPPEELAEAILFLIKSSGIGVIDEITMRRVSSGYFCWE